MRILWETEGRKFKKQLSGQNHLETSDFTRTSLHKLSQMQQVGPLADNCRWRITRIFHYIRNISSLATSAHGYLKLSALHLALKSPGGQLWQSKIFLKIEMSPVYTQSFPVFLSVNKTAIDEIFSFLNATKEHQLCFLTLLLIWYMFFFCTSVTDVFTKQTFAGRTEHYIHSINPRSWRQ